MMKDNYLDICNCPECSYFDMDKAHGCGLPERITARDVSHINDTIQSCLCVNSTLWRHYESLGVG